MIIAIYLWLKTKILQLHIFLEGIQYLQMSLLDEGMNTQSGFELLRCRKQLSPES